MPKMPHQLSPLTKLLNSPMSPLTPQGRAAMEASKSPSRYIAASGKTRQNEEKARQEARLAKLKNGSSK